MEIDTTVYITKKDKRRVIQVEASAILEEGESSRAAKALFRYHVNQALKNIGFNHVFSQDSKYISGSLSELRANSRGKRSVRD